MLYIVSIAIRSKRKTYLERNRECLDLDMYGHYHFSYHSSTTTYQIDHALFLNYVAQSFLLRLYFGAFGRYVDPDLGYVMINISEAKYYEASTIWARCLDAIVMFDHIFLPSWYLQLDEHRSHILMLVIPTFHTLMMF
jgi:hypothetical protein